MFVAKEELEISDIDGDSIYDIADYIRTPKINRHIIPPDANQSHVNNAGASAAEHIYRDKNGIFKTSTNASNAYEDSSDATLVQRSVNPYYGGV